MHFYPSGGTCGCEYSYLVTEEVRPGIACLTYIWSSRGLCKWQVLKLVVMTAIFSMQCRFTCNQLLDRKFYVTFSTWAKNIPVHISVNPPQHRSRYSTTRSAQVCKSDILSTVAQYGVSVTESCVARLPINTPGYISLYLASPSILSDSLDESVVSNPSCDCYWASSYIHQTHHCNSGCQFLWDSTYFYQCTSLCTGWTKELLSWISYNLL